MHLVQNCGLIWVTILARLTRHIIPMYGIQDKWWESCWTWGMANIQFQYVSDSVLQSRWSVQEMLAHLKIYCCIGFAKKGDLQCFQFSGVIFVYLPLPLIREERIIGWGFFSTTVSRDLYQTFSAGVSKEVCNGKLLWRFCSDFASSLVHIFVYKLFWWFDGKNVQVPPLLYVYASSKEIQTLCCKKTNIVHPIWLNWIINAIGETCISSISMPNFLHGWVSLQCSNKPKGQLRQLHSHVRTILATPLCLLETMVASGGSQWNTSTYLICPGSVQKNIVEVTLRSKKKC